MLEAILQASFSEFLNEIEPGTWIPLRVFVLRDISVTDRKWFSIWFTATQNRLKKLLITRNRKGEKKRVSVEFLKSLV